jgi:ATP-dependent Clp protease ATP-binding subunit ClpC
MNEMFTELARKAIEYARDEAGRLRHDYIGLEHLLLGLIKLGEGRAVEIITIIGLDLDDVKQSVEDVLGPSAGTMTVGQLPLTAQAKKTIEVSAQEARALKSKNIDTEHILLALLKDEEGVAAQVLTMYDLCYSDVLDELKNILAGDPSLYVRKRRKIKTPALDHFGRDLTELARWGELDPVVGRDDEIERLTQVLSRRSRNNPVLIGEPGVGKKSIVEGLAERITTQEFSHALRDRRIVALDVTLLVAGARQRGQLEERLMAIVQETVKAGDVIIFIDDVHTLVDLRSAESSLTALQMLKPALSRGELHCIGATTLSRYRRHIEKNSAVDNLFQTVMIDPTSNEDTIRILQGLRHKYEEHHKVLISDEAIKAAVDLSEVHFPSRCSPSRAINVIDDACALKSLKVWKYPESVTELDKEIDALARKKERAIRNQEWERATKWRDELRILRDKRIEIAAEWEKKIESQKAVVDRDTVHTAISKLTGIPVDRMTSCK